MLWLTRAAMSALRDEEFINESWQQQKRREGPAVPL